MGLSIHLIQCLDGNENGSHLYFSLKKRISVGWGHRLYQSVGILHPVVIVLVYEIEESV